MKASPWNSRILGFVNLCIRISKLYCNVSLKLILEANGLHTGNSLDDSRLSVRDVSNCSFGPHAQVLGMKPSHVHSKMR